MVYKVSELKGKLKVGDRVKDVDTSSLSFCSVLDYGKIGTITKVNEDYFCINGCPHNWVLYGNYDLDLLTEPKTLDNLEVGDILAIGNSNKQMVLGIVGKVCILSLVDDFESVKGLYTKQELKNYGHKVFTPDPVEAVEAIEINGKKYNKQEVEERLKDLKPLE